MNNYTGELVAASMFLGLGGLALIPKKGRLLGVVFLVPGLVAAGSYVSWKQHALTDRGSLEGALILDSGDGPRVITLDAVRHTNALAVIPSRSGSEPLHWKERRLSAFDLASGRRLWRKSNEATGYPTTRLLGEFGDHIGVNEEGGGHFTLLDADGHEVGGIRELGPRALQLNPSVGKMSSFGFDDSSDCLELASDTFAIKLDPHTLRQVGADDYCKPDPDEKRVSFSKDQSLVIQEVAQELPPGAQPLGQKLGIFVESGRATTPIESQSFFVKPRFAMDSRTRQPIVAASGALVLYGDATTSVALITSSGKAAWQLPLPAGDLETMSMVDSQIVIVVGSGKAI
jgi:hypothetical protein